MFGATCWWESSREEKVILVQGCGDSPGEERERGKLLWYKPTFQSYSLSVGLFVHLTQTHTNLLCERECTISGKQWQWGGGRGVRQGGEGRLGTRTRTRRFFFDPTLLIYFRLGTLGVTERESSINHGNTSETDLRLSRSPANLFVEVDKSPSRDIRRLRWLALLPALAHISFGTGAPIPNAVHLGQLCTAYFHRMGKGIGGTDRLGPPRLARKTVSKHLWPSVTIIISLSGQSMVSWVIIMNYS